MARELTQDDFLKDVQHHVMTIAHDDGVRRQMSAAADMLRHYVGISIDNFDGEIAEADFRGSIPQMKFVLSAGGKEIDCISTTLSVDEIKTSMKCRVVVEGEAIYGGRHGLPERLDVRKINYVETGNGVERWRGTFDHFDVSPWGE